MKRQFLITVSGENPDLQEICNSLVSWANPGRGTSVSCYELEPQERIDEFNRKMADLEEEREWDPASIQL